MPYAVSLTYKISYNNYNSDPFQTTRFMAIPSTGIITIRSKSNSSFTTACKGSRLTTYLYQSSPWKHVGLALIALQYQGPVPGPWASCYNNACDYVACWAWWWIFGLAVWPEDEGAGSLGNICWAFGLGLVEGYVVLWSSHTLLIPDSTYFSIYTTPMFTGLAADRVQANAYLTNLTFSHILLITATNRFLLVTRKCPSLDLTFACVHLCALVQSYLILYGVQHARLS